MFVVNEYNIHSILIPAARGFVGVYPRCFRAAFVKVLLKDSEVELVIYAMNNIEIILRVLYKSDNIKKRLPRAVQLSSFFNRATFPDYEGRALHSVREPFLDLV